MIDIHVKDKATGVKPGFNTSDSLDGIAAQ